MTENKCGVYLITCTANGRQYVGSAVNIPARWGHHVWDLNNGRHVNRHLTRAWKKYGCDAFDFSVLEYTIPDMRLEREREWMLSLKPDFNHLVPDPASDKFVPTDETRQRMSASLKGIERTPEWRANLSAALKGKPLSAAFMAASKVANSKPKSAEHKARIAEAHRGKKRAPFSAEWKAKIAASMREHWKNKHA